MSGPLSRRSPDASLGGDGASSAGHHTMHRQAPSGGIFPRQSHMTILQTPQMQPTPNVNIAMRGFDKKRVRKAYMMAIPPLGWMGGHHFYLRRPNWAVLYMFTLGLFLVGWLYDLCRMYCLVKRMNKKIHRGEVNAPLKYLSDAYSLWFPPGGLLGIHQFYLKRYKWGFLYLFTLGIFGFGWLVDLFRLPSLVKRTNRSLLGSERHDVRQFPSTNTGVDNHRSDASAEPSNQPQSPQVFIFTTPGSQGGYPPDAAHMNMPIEPPPYHLVVQSNTTTNQNSASHPGPSLSSLPNVREGIGSSESENENVMHPDPVPVQELLRDKQELFRSSRHQTHSDISSDDSDVDFHYPSQHGEKGHNEVMVEIKPGATLKK